MAAWIFAIDADAAQHPIDPFQASFKLNRCNTEDNRPHGVSYASIAKDATQPTIKPPTGYQERLKG